MYRMNICVISFSNYPSVGTFFRITSMKRVHLRRIRRFLYNYLLIQEFNVSSERLIEKFFFCQEALYLSMVCHSIEEWNERYLKKIFFRR